MAKNNPKKKVRATSPAATSGLLSSSEGASGVDTKEEQAARVTVAGGAGYGIFFSNKFIVLETVCYQIICEKHQ